MAPNSNPPDAKSDGLGNIATAGGIAVTKPSTVRERPHPKNLVVRSCPKRPEHWLVAVDELTEFPIRRDRLTRWKRFRNIARHQIGVEFPKSVPANWAALVAEAEGGAA
jgi:hypothetical protein